MGLFKTTLKDIEICKEKGNVKKLVKALSNRNSEVAIASFNALKDLNFENSFEDMAFAIIKTTNIKLEKSFRKFIENKQPVFMEIFLKHMINNIKNLGISCKCKQYLLEFKDSSFPLIIALLDHDDLNIRIEAAGILKEIDKDNSRNQWIPSIIELLENDNVNIRIKAAEILKEIDEESSRKRREYILEEKFIIEKGIDFNSVIFKISKSVINKDDWEIPLVEFTCTTQCTSEALIFTLKKPKAIFYQFGLTDEYIYILPDLAPGLRGIFLKIPISSQVKKIERSELGFEIHCESVVPDPNAGSEETSILKFKINRFNEERVDKAIKLLHVLKTQKLKKTEIFEKFYDKNNLSRY